MEYLPTFTQNHHPNPNVGKYTIHGAYGHAILLFTRVRGSAFDQEIYRTDFDQWMFDDFILGYCS